MKLSLIDVPERNRVQFDKRNDIWNNGIDNAYPTLVERIINASVTAKACAGVLAKFIYGDGFAFENELREKAKSPATRFNRESLYSNPGRQTPNKLLKIAARQAAYHKGVFFHVNYNALFQKTSVAILPYKHCRLGKEGSSGYKEKIVVYDNWDRCKKNRIDPADFDVIDAYNPDPAVILKQVQRSGGWEKYKGQVLFLNLDDTDNYPLPYADAALLDCDSEAQSGVFKNRGLRKGFFGKYMLYTKPFENEQDKAAFQAKIKNAMGAENNETILHFEAELQNDELEKEILLKEIKTNIDDRIFSHTETTVANNIRKAFGNIPPVLIDWVEGKMGGTSGASFKEAQAYFVKQTEEERNEIEEAFEELFYNFHRPVNPSGNWKIRSF